jgi:RHS repeat-associated protein
MNARLTVSSSLETLCVDLIQASASEAATTISGGSCDQYTERHGPCTWKEYLFLELCLSALMSILTATVRRAFPLSVLLVSGLSNLLAQAVPASIGGLDITPDGGSSNVVAGTTGNEVIFQVHNGNSTAGTYTFACSATGQVTCVSVVPASATIPAGGNIAELTVRFNANATAGTGKITATANPSGESGFFNITVQALGPPVTVRRSRSGHNQDRTACFTTGAGEAAGVSCGDLFVAHAMPVYRAYGRDRSLSLIYNSATATGLNLVPATISFPQTVSLPDTVAAWLMVDASRDSARYQPPATGTIGHIVLGRGLTPLVTGVHAETLAVRSRYITPAASRDIILTGPSLIVNRSASEFGQGWSLLGLEQVILPADTTQRVWVDGDGSIRLYHKGVALTSSMLSQSGLPSLVPAQAVDGITTVNAWNTSAATAGAWLRVDLGAQPQAVTTLRVFANDPQQAVYDVEWSDNATTWAKAYTGFRPGSGWRALSWNSVGVHRYWRLLLMNTPGSGGWLTELSFGAALNFYGAPGSRPDSLVRYDTLGVKWYRRNLPHGAAVSFEETGLHRLTTSRVGARTLFTWGTVNTKKRLMSIVVPPNDGTTRAYTFYWNASTQLLDSIVDPGLRRLKATMSGGSLTSLTDPDGQVTSFTYANSRMTRRTVARVGMPGGVVGTVFGYANSARLTSVKIPWGPTAADTSQSVLTPWDEQGLGTTWAGQTTVIVDTAGAKTHIDGPLAGTGDAVDIWVDPFGGIKKSLLVGTGSTTQLWRDSTGTLPIVVTRMREQQGHTVSLTYNGRGNVVMVRDSAPAWQGAKRLPTKVRTYSYNSTVAPDSPTAVTDTVGGAARTDTYAYIPAAIPVNPLTGLLQSIVDRRGHHTSFAYKTGALVGLVDSVTEEQVETYKETGANDVTDVLDNQAVRFTYDANGNRITATSPAGVVTSYVPDNLGRTMRVDDALGTRTDYSYDAMNRLLTGKVYSNGQANVYGINPLGTHLAQGRACDTTQVICKDTTEAFQAGFPATRTTTFAYDAAKALSSIADPRGVTRTYGYDASGGRWINADDYGHVDSTYFTKTGAVDTTISRAGNKVTRTYDASGRLATLIYPSVTATTIVTDPPQTVPGATLTYQYDNMNRLTVAKRGADSVVRQYYSDGSLYRRISTVGFVDSITYSYNAAGAMDTVVHNRDTTVYSYVTASGDLQAMSIRWAGRTDGPRVFSFLWDALGRRRQVTYPTDPVGGNNMTVKYRYDGEGRLRRLVSAHPGAPANGSRQDEDVFDFTLRNNLIDATGRILWQELSCAATAVPNANPCGGTVASRIRKHLFNRMGMLTLQDISGATADTMRYDASGNLIYRAFNDDVLAGFFGHTFVIDSSAAGSHNQMTKDSANPVIRSPLVYSYLAQGSRRRDSPLPFFHDSRELYYHYDGLERMSGITFRDPQDVSHVVHHETACAYDPEGNLVASCAAGAPFMAFDGANVSATLMASDGGWRFVHGPGIDDPLTGYYRGADGNRILYFVTDGGGRLYATADSSGWYDSSNDLNDKRNWHYVGGTRASETFGAERQTGEDAPKLSFFRNRAYDQATGRFTQEDPIGIVGGLNLYAYAANNPVTFTDPFGLCPELPCRSPDDPNADRPLPAGVDEKDVTWDPSLGEHGGYWHDKDGRRIIPQPETKGHYDRWEIITPGVKTPSYSPKRSVKPWPGQKRLKPDQSWTDPNEPIPPVETSPVQDALDWIYRHIPKVPSLPGLSGAGALPELAPIY